MIRFYFLILPACFLLTIGCKDNSVGPVPINTIAFERNKLLGNGITIGNALEAPNEGDWGVTIQEEYFKIIKDAGFNSVRIPIKWSAHSLNIQPYTIDTNFFNRIDEVLGWAFNYNLAVIINIHHYDEIMQNPMAEKERFLSIWKQIALHYKNYSSNLFFEILNEPNSALTAGLWNVFLKEAITTIRETNPDRSILIGTAEWGGLSALQKLEFPSDDNNLILSVHYYLPFEFTHQGAEWIEGSNNWLGTKWEGNTVEREIINQDIKTAANWAAMRNVPFNLGEFGSYYKADMNSRVRWTAAVSAAARNYGASFNYWEFCAGFGIYNRDTKEFNPLLSALIPNG
jgi:endoglucanase